MVEFDYVTLKNIMRVITGKLKGKKLISPPDDLVRPTADRVKESLFNIIHPLLLGSHCADLFAGSGNLGIEALSRGAEHCVFVDKSSDSLQIVRKNLISCKLELVSTIIESDIFKCFPQLEKHTPFDLIFADPPYDFPNIYKLPKKIEDFNLLKPKGWFILEHSKLVDVTSFTVKELTIKDQRTYGKTTITLYQKD